MPNKNIRKVLEFFVPTGYLLNDNVKNDFRTNMGKMKWLTEHTTMAVDNAENDYPDNPKLICWVAKKETININPNHFGIIINHVKPTSKAFDLLNYERTMKPSIDVLTANGYWTDDNCHVCNPAILMGGTYNKPIADPFKILPPELSEGADIIKYFEEHIPPFWLAKTKYKKITDYDLFQLYTIKY